MSDGTDFFISGLRQVLNSHPLVSKNWCKLHFKSSKIKVESVASDKTLSVPPWSKNPEFLCQKIVVLTCINYNYLAAESSDDKFCTSELSENGQTKSSKSMSPLVADLVLDLLVKVNWDFLPFFTLVVAVKFWWFA